MQVTGNYYHPIRVTNLQSVESLVGIIIRINTTGIKISDGISHGRLVEIKLRAQQDVFLELKYWKNNKRHINKYQPTYLKNTNKLIHIYFLHCITCAYLLISTVNIICQ